MSTRFRSYAVAFGIMLGGAALAFASQPGTTDAQAPTVYRGYLDTQTVYGPRQFTLRVDALTDEGALHRAEAALLEGGQNAMFATLGRMQPSGWLQIDQGVGYPVAVVNQRRVDGGIEVVALINRPVGFGELFTGTLSRDFPFGLIVINVDEDGLGNGTLVPAARARVAADGTITFSDLEAVPYRLFRIKGAVEDRS